MGMTDQQETTIGKTSRITLGLVIVVVVLLLGGAGTTISAVIAYTSARHTDREENRQGREEILAAIQGLKDSQAAYQNATNAAIQKIKAEAEHASRDRWPASAMKIWVLQCQKDGTFVDPDQIIDRYVK